MNFIELALSVTKCRTAENAASSKSHLKLHLNLPVEPTVWKDGICIFEFAKLLCLHFNRLRRIQLGFPSRNFGVLTPASRVNIPDEHSCGDPSYLAIKGSFPYLSFVLPTVMNTQCDRFVCLTDEGLRRLFLPFANRQFEVAASNGLWDSKFEQRWINLKT